MDGISDQKAKLRRAVLHRRHGTSQEIRDASGKRLADAAIDAGIVQANATIACFVSMGSEVPTSALLDHFLDIHAQILVPRLGSGLDMGWSRYSGAAGLVDMGGHRPAEPADRTLPADALAQASTIFVAALAVDRLGNRLGRGAGWYDKALRYRNQESRIIAICWPWEFSDRPVPHSSFDVRVDGVLTPRSFTPIDKLQDARPYAVQ
ncbi:5-formyltetrahydrofolate cyclo-ligase [Bifidobacterium fermentum]|uniref:5-formyltetrahydrofolate cyclo-ligase n=1 Tax=Bifidobacterium fermentum TaxID=3059035 RepID=A0AB39UGS5_9BIFI